MGKSMISFFGWYGMLAVLGAYTLMSFRIVSQDDFLYIFLNLSGAIGIFWFSLARRAYPLVVLNVVWALVAIFSLLQFFGLTAGRGSL
ncbi:MAG TPA: hypothetical protein VJ179_02545 [Patescibacteria group bacterium]|nr:hypothetical protein [Patescibacteria group bacterium]